MSARKRYVTVSRVSRTTSRSGTTWSLPMGHPDRLPHGLQADLLEDRRDLLRDFIEDSEALRDDRRSDLHGAGSGHDVLQGVPARPDAPDPDDRDLDLLEDIVHRSDADRSDRGSAETTEAVREDGHLQLGGDRHRLHGVNRYDPIRTALLRGDRERSDVPHVRGELREDGQVDRVLHGLRELEDRVLVLRDLRAEALCVRTGEVQFDRRDAVAGHLCRDVCVLACILSEHGADYDGARRQGLLHLTLVLDDPGIRQADCIEQSRIEFHDGRVQVSFARLRADALRDDGPRAGFVDASHGGAGLVEKSGREHRRVPELQPGDLRPEVDHPANGNEGGAKGFGSVGSRRPRPERSWRERAAPRSSPSNLYQSRLSSEPECASLNWDSIRASWTS